MYAVCFGVVRFAMKAFTKRKFSKVEDCLGFCEVWCFGKILPVGGFFWQWKFM